MNYPEHALLQERVSPQITLLCGWAGLIPFAVLAGAAVVSGPQYAAVATDMLVYYGAMIHTFLGGVHWGIAINRAEPNPRLFVSGVLPSLVAALAIVLPAPIAILILSVGFMGLLLYNRNGTAAYARS